MSQARYVVGDVFDRLAELPDGSIHSVITSPPYWRKRRYLPVGHPMAHKEIGQEPTPGAFLATMLRLTDELWRIVRDDGTIWINLGDTASGSGGAGGDYLNGGLREGQNRYKGPASGANEKRPARSLADVPRAKSVCWIPELFGASLAYGRNLLTGEPCRQWITRPQITWCKPSVTPGEIIDKFREATELIVWASKQQSYYFDLDSVRLPPSDYERPNGAARATPPGQRPRAVEDRVNPKGAPPLNWWKVNTSGYEGAHFACVDDQTEALTPSGWRRHDQLKLGDQIAAYNAERHVIIWQPATIHRYFYDGELIAIDQRETSQRLTPNHRVIHRTARGFIRTRRADEASSGWRVPVAAPFDVCGSGPGDVMAALLGWYVTEGSRKSNSSVIFWQSESANPKHCARLRDLLDGAHAEYTETRRVRPIGSTVSPRKSIEVQWSVRGRVAADLLALAPDKQLPGEVLGWSDSECFDLLDALIDGDGHTRPSGRRAFIQKDRGCVDMVQALCCRLGLRSTISPRRDGGWSLTIGERTWLSLRGTNGAHAPIGREWYAGTVWCPNVETGYWLARRDGRPFITGNTFPPELIVRPVIASCPPGGTILDPFGGSGTTAAVATGHGRNCISIDFDSRNADLARERVGMFLEVDDEPNPRPVVDVHPPEGA